MIRENTQEPKIDLDYVAVFAKDKEEDKNKYLVDGRNFTPMIRKDLEMIELKGVDVLVYFPDEPLGDRLKLKEREILIPTPASIKPIGPLVSPQPPC